MFRNSRSKTAHRDKATRVTEAAANGQNPAAKVGDSDPIRALICVNVQNDYFPGGSFPLNGAEEALKVINSLRLKKFDLVAVSAIEHPHNHTSFCSNNPGTLLYEVVPTKLSATLGPQVMWPDHCVMGTYGADFRYDLHVEPTDIIVRTGHVPHEETHSIFARDPDTPGSLLHSMKVKGVTEVYIAGLLTDFQVQFTALDVKALMPEAQVFVIEDGSAGLTSSGVHDAYQKFQVERIQVVRSDSKQVRKLPDIFSVQESPRHEPTSPMRRYGSSGGPPTGGGTPHHGADGPDARGYVSKNRFFDAELDELAHDLSLDDDITDGDIAPDVARADDDSIDSSVLVVACARGDHMVIKAQVETLPGVINDELRYVGVTPLIAACIVGDADTVAVLLEHGANPNGLGPQGMPPISVAISNGSLDVVRLLLRHKDTDITLQDRLAGMSPLMVAAQHCDVTIVELLLRRARGLSSTTVHDFVNTTNKWGATAVMLACAASGDNISSTWERFAPAPPSSRQKGGGVPPAIHTAEHAAYQDIRSRASEVVGIILEAVGQPARRMAMMRKTENNGWTALHFAAKSGMLASIEWSLLNPELKRTPVNIATHAGVTMLHLATWNGHATSVAVLLGSWPGMPNPWRARVRVNFTMKGRKHTEFDLAVMRNNIDSARLICRAGGTAAMTTGPACQRMLARLILRGDGITSELMLRHKVNKLKVDKHLVNIVRVMKYPDTCTFTFAAYHNPTTQHMFECTVCDVRVCLLCRDRCHVDHQWSHTLDHHHELEYVGDVQGYCQCAKDTCKALQVVDEREAAGYKYVPNPLDTSDIDDDEIIAGEDPDDLVLILARNSHEVWARAKMEEGWQYGAQRDDNEKMHPQLLPYEYIPDEYKHNDQDTALQTLRVIRAVGYDVEHDGIARGSAAASRVPSRVGIPSPSPLSPSRAATGAGAAPTIGLGIRMSPPVPPAEGSATGTRAAQRLSMESRDEAAGHTGTRSARSASGETSDGDESHVPDTAQARHMDRERKRMDKRPSLATSNASSHEIFEHWRPSPIDVSDVALPQHMVVLKELIAQDMHESWAHGMMKRGWAFGPFRLRADDADVVADAAAARAAAKEAGRARPRKSVRVKRRHVVAARKVSPMLVPYKFLNEKEKDLNRTSADSILRLMVYFGYSFRTLPGRRTVDADKLTKHITDQQISAVKRRETQMREFKQGVYNSFLANAASWNNAPLIELLLNAPRYRHQSAYANAVDEQGRSALYTAVQHGHVEASKMLLQFGASMELADVNGVTAISIAAYHGFTELMELLLSHGAQYTVRDKIQMTPIHYAAYAGHRNICNALGRKLTARSKHGIDFTLTYDEGEGRGGRFVGVVERLMGKKNAARDRARSDSLLNSRKDSLLTGRKDSVMSTNLDLPGPTDQGKQQERVMMRLTSVATEFTSAGITPFDVNDVRASSLGNNGAGTPDNDSVASDLTAPDVDLKARMKQQRERTSERHLSSDRQGGQRKYDLWKIGGSGMSASARHLGGVEGGSRKGSLLGGPVSPLSRSSSESRILFASGATARTAPLRTTLQSQAMIASAHQQSQQSKPATLGTRGRSNSGSRSKGRRGRRKSPRSTKAFDFSGDDESKSAPGDEKRSAPKLTLSMPSPMSAAALGSSAPNSADKAGTFNSGLDYPFTPQTLFNLLGDSSRAEETKFERTFRSRVGAALLSPIKARLSPLTLACYARRYDVVRALTLMGSDPNYKDDSGVSPYDRALYDHVRAKHAVKDLLAERAAAQKASETRGAGLGSLFGATAEIKSLATAMQADAPLEDSEAAETETATAADDDGDTSDTGGGEAKPMSRAAKILSGHAKASHKVHPRSNLRSHASNGESRWGLVRNKLQLSASALGAAIQPKNDTATTDTRNAEDQATRRERMIAVAERRSELAIDRANERVHSAALMVETLNESSAVKKRRTLFAVRTLMQKVLAFMMVVVVIGSMTPVAPDYPSAETAALRASLLAHIGDTEHDGGISFGAVDDADSWWDWFDTTILWASPVGSIGASDASATAAMLSTCDNTATTASSRASFLRPDPAFARSPCLINYPAVLQENLIVGAIRVTVLSHTLEECNSGSSAGSAFVNGPDTCISAAGDKAAESAADGSSVGAQVTRTVLLLPSANVTQRRILSLAHRTLAVGDADGDAAAASASGVGTHPWLSRAARSISVETTLYNPNLKAFVGTRLTLVLRRTGRATPVTELDIVVPFNGRFPPSVIFQITFGVLVFFQTVALSMEIAHDGIGPFFRSGWNWCDATSVVLAIVLIVVDVGTLAEAERISADALDDLTFVDVHAVAERLILETDLIAIIILLMVVRVLKYLRIVPGWGPMVVAVLMTWQDTSVLTYLAVTLGLTFTLSVAFHAAFGAEVPEFSSIPSSFYVLFTMSFAEDWHEVEGGSPRATTTIFYIAYVVFAVVLLNLFIGIVTDVYPKASKRSQLQWENFITDMMEADVEERLNNAGGGMSAMEHFLWRVLTCRRPPAGDQRRTGMHGGSFVSKLGGPQGKAVAVAEARGKELRLTEDPAARLAAQLTAQQETLAMAPVHLCCCTVHGPNKEVDRSLGRESFAALSRVVVAVTSTSVPDVSGADAAANAAKKGDSDDPRSVNKSGIVELAGTKSQWKSVQDVGAHTPRRVLDMSDPSEPSAAGPHPPSPVNFASPTGGGDGQAPRFFGADGAPVETAPTGGSRAGASAVMHQQAVLNEKIEMLGTRMADMHDLIDESLLALSQQIAARPGVAIGAAGAGTGSNTRRTSRLRGVDRRRRSSSGQRPPVAFKRGTAAL